MMKTKPKISLVSASVFLKWLTEGISQIYEEIGHVFDFQMFFLNDVDTGKVSKDEFIKEIYNTDIMLIDIRGNCRTAEILVDTYKSMEEESPEIFEKKIIIALVGGNGEIRRLTKMGEFQARKIPSSSQEYDMKEIPDLTKAVRFGQRMTSMMKTLGRIFPTKVLKHARNWGLMMDYWVFGLAGVAENHKNIVLFLLKNYLGLKDIEVPKPIKIPSFGIYDIIQNKYFNTLEAYYMENPPDLDKQSIGLFFYGGLYFEQSLPVVEEFMLQLEDFNVIPVFSDVMTNLEAHKKFFFNEGFQSISAVINLQYFQLNGGPFGGNPQDTLELLKRLDVPHFNPIIQYDMRMEEYLASNEGITPINQIIAVVMPELDGRYEMITVGALKSLGFSDKINADILEVEPIRENIKLACNRLRKWTTLRNKPNFEKKIAIILYNYPPGEDKIGNASYLDVSQSIINLINVLDQEGYNVKPLPEGKSLTDLFIGKGSVNIPKYTSNSFSNDKSLSKNEYIDMISDFPEKLLDQIEKNWGKIPGNIMIDNSHIKLPIIELENLYLCLQPARSIVSGDSNEYHDKDKPPHHQYLAFYQYLEKALKIDAIIHMGTHGTEEFLPGKECAGGFWDFSINLMGSIPNIYYYHVSNTSEAAIAKRRGNALIINHAGPTFKNSDLYQDFGNLEQNLLEYQNLKEKNSLSRSELQEERIKELEFEIEKLTKNLEIEYSDINELESLIYRYKNSVIPMGLHILGKDYTEEELIDTILMILLHSPEKPVEIEDFVQKSGDTEEEQSSYLKDLLTQIIPRLLKSNEIKYNFSDSKTSEVSALIDWIQNLIERIIQSREMENIIHALEGGYIEPGIGGDPIRSPQIFPTGRNSYGFDPRLIPSSTAYKRGASIANELLENYRNEFGKFPETVSVVLWAFETMKTGGESIGQIFSYLGVRVVKKKSIWTTEFEVIPLDEMEHPRINVLTTICGIFRDTFPYLLELINQAIDTVANLDEPLEMNYVKKTMNDIDNKGIENANARIFGPAPGRYNTNLTEIISAGKWESEKELAKDYMDTLGYAYMSNRKIEKSTNLFGEIISNIDLMSQVRDSSEYNITDLDHYYEFTGGLARSHEELSGKKANVYIADTTKKQILVDTLNGVIREGSITRNLNPKWIKSMLKHKYHGGQKIAERVENMLGLAATTHNVDNWIWDKSYDQYITNKEIRDAIIENNRFSMMDLIKNMIQAENRGYWKADDDKIENLKRLYLQLENWVEKVYE